MQIENSVPIVTGANRGLGAALLDVLFERGVPKVYAAARNPISLQPAIEKHGDKLVPVELDVTKPDQIDAAISACTDVDLVISNAAITCIKSITGEPTIDDFRETMEVNYFGPLQLMRGFAPVLARNGGGGIMQVLSMAGLLCSVAAPAYSASKAAANMLSHAMRSELADQGTQISMSYPGFFDTRMASDFDVPKPTAHDIANAILDGHLEGEIVIFPDTFAKLTEDALITEPKQCLVYPAAVVGGLVGSFMTHPEAGK